MPKLTKLRDRIDKIFLASIILMVPLYQKFPLIKIPGVTVSIRLEDFLLTVLAVYLIPFYLPRLKSLLSNSFERSIIFFLIVGAISVFSGVFLTHTISMQSGLLHWARRVEYFVPFFFALSLKKEKMGGYIEFCIKLLLIVAVVAFIYGLGQKHFDWPVIVTQNVEYSKGIALRYIPGAHITSTFAGHYDLAAFMVLVLPIFGAGIAEVKGKLSKIALWGGFLSGLWLLANSLSRISVFSYLIAIAVTFILMKKFRALLVVLVASVLVFSFSSDLLDRYLSIIRVIKDGVKTISVIGVNEVYASPPTLPGGRPVPSVLAVLEDRSTSIRLNVEWPRALRALTKNPFLGTGYSSITLATDNDYLRLLGEVGVLGAGAFGLVVVQILGFTFDRRRITFKGVNGAYVAGLAGSVVGILLVASFIDVFEASKFAIIFWLVVGLGKNNA